MGEFSLSGNANIGLSAVEIPVNTSKSNTNPIFFTTPTSTTSTDSILQASSRPVMQDELVVDKTIVSGSSNGDDVGGCGVVGSTTTQSQSEKSVIKQPGGAGGECSSDITSSSNDLSKELSEQVAQKSQSSLPPLFHPSTDSGTPSGALWSTALEDNFVSGMTSVNGNLSFQNFPSPNQQQLFGNNSQSQGRRAITASHNFPHNMGRQQSSHPLYKNYSSWASPGQSWSGSSASASAWNRGRSVPNLTPLQQMGVAGRKPSPTFNHQQVISPVKFRRSTSYPGKGPFPQPPTFEITNMDETRELLPYQVI